MNRILAVSICIAALVGCGGDGAAPTTAPPPAPTPTPPAPPPPPPPVPPAAPSGLRVAASGADFIEWTWNAVEGADGYDAQFSSTEAFTDEHEIIPPDRRAGLLPAGGTRSRDDRLSPGTVHFRNRRGSDHERLVHPRRGHDGGAHAAAGAAPATPTGLEGFRQWE